VALQVILANKIHRQLDAVGLPDVETKNLVYNGGVHLRILRILRIERYGVR
jgi:hypothetical protein